MNPVMLAGWIGFGLLVMGFVAPMAGWISARSYAYPILLGASSVAYGYMNYHLAVWPGFVSNIFFLALTLGAVIAVAVRNARIRKAVIEFEESERSEDE